MAATPSGLAAERMKTIRNALGLTQQALADRLAAVGEPMGRGTIAKIEAGLREFSLDELMAVAVALGVSPRAFLVPRDGTVRVAPAVEVEGWEMREYLDGEMMLREQLDRPEEQAIEAIQAFETHLELGARIKRMVRDHPAVHATDALLIDVRYGALRDRHHYGQDGPRGSQLRDALAAVVEQVETLAGRMDELDQEDDR